MNQLNNFDPKANKKPVSDKRKGQTALFFPKWHYTTSHTTKRYQRKIKAIGRGF